MSDGPTPAAIMVEIGAGELIDKLTILEIKADKIGDGAKLMNIRTEMATLRPILDGLRDRYPCLAPLEAELKAINLTLWTIEDDIRGHEFKKDFGLGFIALARSVYLQNDKRAELKKRINTLCHSTIIEEKSYFDFNV